MSSSLLINESPLQLLPTLATRIGLNEAIVLQQIQYWIDGNEKRKSKHHFIDGRWWTYNTAEEWQEQFPFWSVSTVRRVHFSLKDSGLVIAEKHGQNGFDHTLWYTIDYDALNDLAKLGKSYSPNSSNTDLANLDKSTYTETSITESSTETPPPSRKLAPHQSNMLARENRYSPTMKPPIKALCEALETVTQSLNAAKVEETAYTLYGYEVTPTELLTLYGGANCYWRRVDWRGQKGNRPELGNITGTIMAAREWLQTEGGLQGDAATALEYLITYQTTKQAVGWVNGADKIARAAGQRLGGVDKVTAASRQELVEAIKAVAA